MSNESSTFQFQAEIKQVLSILIHSLYSEREIFLRELISNASDALTRVQFQQLTNSDVVSPDAPLEIRVTPDEEAGTLTISDTGDGMTREELIGNLGTIAHSGAKAFIEAVQQAQGAPIQDVIGQFGVGFYSIFMVADKVQVVTRSYHPDGTAWIWESDGGESYSIEAGERETRGTDLILYLKEDAKEYLQKWTLKDIIRRHSDYVTFPIYVADETEPTNKQTAIWRQEAKDITDDQYNEFYRSLTFDFEPPAHRIHMRTDSPLQFYALLYLPATGTNNMMMRRSEPGLKLYARKILIQENNTDLLPEYLSWVVGVVDSEDLPLNVSRETVRDSLGANRVMANLRKAISNKVLSELKRLAKNKFDTYKVIYGEFGRMIKQGITMSPADREDIEPLLFFPSSKSANEDEWTSLEKYVEGFATNQQDIYYVMADDFASASRSPHLDTFRKRGIEVLYFVDPADTVMLMGLSEYKEHTLRSVDDADIDLSGIGEEPAEEEDAPKPVAEADFEQVRERFATVLGDRVQEVRESKNLVGSAARLVSKDNDPQRNMFRINRLLDREYELPVKILELNPRHPLIHNLTERLTENSENPIIDSVITQVFETALLQEGIHPDPSAMAQRLFELMQAATKK